MLDADDELMNHPSPLDMMEAFFQQEGWPWEQVEGSLILRTAFTGQHGVWIGLAYWQPESALCLFYSVATKRAPTVLRPAVAEFLTRANWGLLYGNFELDYDDGEIRFKTSLQIVNGLLSPEQLRPMILGNVATMDRYLPGLYAVISLAQTPIEAIATIENAQPPNKSGNNQ